MNKTLSVQKVAVLGASMIGAQIAALFANAGIEVILFDALSKEGDPNEIAMDALIALTHFKPPQFAEDSLHQFIKTANYDYDGILLKDCDLIVETIPERLDWKTDLYQKISQFISENSMILCQTSILCVEKLSMSLHEKHRERFCGIHFFSQPRYLSLVELIPSAHTSKEMLNQLETFLVSILNRKVILAKNTPNFIANRVGIFFSLVTLIQAERHKINPENIDIILKTFFGEQSLPPLQFLDKLGLDVFQQLVLNLNQNALEDPWHFTYQIPMWIKSLIFRGALGEKSKTGIYRKLNPDQDIAIADKQGNYKTHPQKANPELLSLLNKASYKEKFSIIKESGKESGLMEAKFLWAVLRDLFHYIAFHLDTIADSVRDIDLVFRYLFGWELGPFEIWQSIGFKEVGANIHEDISHGLSLCQKELPYWVTELNAMGFGVYKKSLAYSAKQKIYQKRSKLPVFERQIYPEMMLEDEEDFDRILFETKTIKLMTSPKIGNEIGILSFKEAHNRISEELLGDCLLGIEYAEKELKALIVWQKENKDFCLGFDLKCLLEASSKNKSQALTSFIHAFQKVSLALRYSTIPIIAAISGDVLGGGLELMLHCSRIVAALESYLSFDHTQIGIIPAGGGCKELAYRSFIQTETFDHFETLEFYFKNVQNAKKTQSALEAKRLGLIREQDVIMMNPKEILFVAAKLAKFLLDSNYKAPRKQNIQVMGKPGWARLQLGLIKSCEKGLLSEHDYFIADGLAKVFCGGEMEADRLVKEEWLLELEKQFFVELMQHKKTIERMHYMLEHNSALRN